MGKMKMNSLLYKGFSGNDFVDLAEKIQKFVDNEQDDESTLAIAQTTYFQPIHKDGRTSAEAVIVFQKTPKPQQNPTPLANQKPAASMPKGKTPKKA